MSKKNKNNNNAATGFPPAGPMPGVPNAGGFPPTGPGGAFPPTNPGGAFPPAGQGGVIPPMGQSGAVPPAGAAPPTAPRQSKGGKVKGGTDKRKRPGLPYSGAQPNLSSLSPDQMNQMQLEEAIKESSNPAMKLKRLKSPLSFKSCLLNILLLAVLTIIVAFVFVWIFKVDRFNPIYIAADMLNDFGITKFFVDLGKRIANLFSGKGWTLDVIKMLINFIR